MNILLLGSGGREHAIAHKIAQSNKTSQLFIAPGNAGTLNCGTNVNINNEEFEAVKENVKSEVRIQRAKHAVYENQRTIKAVKALLQ